MKDITLREHLTKISKERWKNASKEDKTAHSKMMNTKRWSKKKKEKAPQESPEKPI